MANRRMVSKSISYSKQVSSISEFAQLLFTWIIPHLDDFGRIDGDPEVIKAMVMPLSKRPTKDFEKSIRMMVKHGLIDRYKVEGRSVIEYPAFDRHQTGLNKRTKSRYPDNPNDPRSSKNFQEITKSYYPNEGNITEHNQIEKNKSYPVTQDNKINFIPKNENEKIALEAWEDLEPENPENFPMYLRLLERGLKPHDLETLKDEALSFIGVANTAAYFISKAKKKLGMADNEKL